DGPAHPHRARSAGGRRAAGIRAVHPAAVPAGGQPAAVLGRCRRRLRGRPCEARGGRRLSRRVPGRQQRRPARVLPAVPGRHGRNRGGVPDDPRGAVRRRHGIPALRRAGAAGGGRRAAWMDGVRAERRARSRGPAAPGRRRAGGRVCGRGAAGDGGVARGQDGGAVRHLGGGTVPGGRPRRGRRLGGAARRGAGPRRTGRGIRHSARRRAGVPSGRHRRAAPPSPGGGARRRRPGDDRHGAAFVCRRRGRSL
ncbi:MAG: FIG00823051: hypothetical protein, partial [uncultured Gemmatimonadetes bacterium]